MSQAVQIAQVLQSVPLPMLPPELIGTASVAIAPETVQQFWVSAFDKWTNLIQAPPESFAPKLVAAE